MNTPLKLAPTSIDEIERLEKGATPGPWETCIVPDIGTEIWAAEQTPICRFPYDWNVRTGGADNSLIVTLRNAAPELIQRARRAERLEEALRRVEDELLPEARYRPRWNGDEVYDEPENAATRAYEISRRALIELARAALEGDSP